MVLLLNLCLVFCLSLRKECSAQFPFIQPYLNAESGYAQQILTASSQTLNGQDNGHFKTEGGSTQKPPPSLDQIPLETRRHVPMTENNICLANPPNPSAIQISVPDNCGETTIAALFGGHPDQHLNTGQILAKYRYAYQIHNVVTADGYILTLHRITNSPYFRGNPNARKPAVLLQHGLLSASDNWLWQPLNRNLAMKLADAGFEVWLGDIRGNTYSRGHIKLNHETDLAYWDFSWQEMAEFDVPAMVDYILHVSQNQKIIYVGHSMGTTMIMAALSQFPELNEKIEACFLLAPIAFLGHLNNAIRRVVPFLGKDGTFQLVNAALRGVIQTTDHFMNLLHVSLGDICVVSVAKCGLCNNLYFLAFGFNPSQVNPHSIPNIFQKFPNSASVKTIAHYAQLVADCSFKKYDFGTLRNLAKYNSPTPPHYNLDAIRVPMYLFYGDNDNLGVPNDVFTTASKLAPGVLKLLQRVPHDLFTHMDFLSGQDADILVYNQILDIMNQYLQRAGVI